MYTLNREGSIRFYSPKANQVSKCLPVFYNPKMKLGRDIALFIINRIKPKKILDPMAGTGIRSLRILNETTCRDILANDINPVATKLMQKNAKLNNLNLKIENKDINILLHQSQGFDYIDIDPFGSPVYYLESSISSLKNNGILAVTATDLGPLYGKYINACKRKYDSTPLNCYLKKELGLRILAQKVQKTAAKYDKALFPIFSHASDHYVRVYFRCLNSRSLTNKILKKIGHLNYCPKCLSTSSLDSKCCGKKMLKIGPLWLGHLWDINLTENFNLIDHIKDESKIHTIGFHDIPSYCKRFKMNSDKKMNKILEDIWTLGYKASRTHLDSQAIRSDIPKEEFLKII